MKNKDNNAREVERRTGVKPLDGGGLAWLMDGKLVLKLYKLRITENVITYALEKEPLQPSILLH